MKRIESVREMQDLAGRLRREGRRIAFVPTMGYLHEGHLSLIDEARKAGDVVVVSVFVNPTQFGPGEDFDVYPRDISGDETKAAGRGADILFHPSAREMYPGEPLTRVHVEKITEVLCGARRRGHFSGVATVVTKLFNIVRPHAAVFGQKDAQQAAVIMTMVRDLNMDVEIRIVPTVREKDGLAMSSRNVRLSPEQRKHAVMLSKVLFGLRDTIRPDTAVEPLLKEAEATLSGLPGAELEYLEMRSFPGLEPVERFDRDAVIALAVRFGEVRLIDNILLKNDLDS